MALPVARPRGQGSRSRNPDKSHQFTPPDSFSSPEPSPLAHKPCILYTSHQSSQYCSTVLPVYFKRNS